MGVLERWLRKERPTQSFDDIMLENEIVSVLPEGPAFVVAEREKKLAANTNISILPDLRELGSTSPSPYTWWLRQEYNPELRDLQGLRKYDEMRRSDATVRGSLRLAKTPVLAARWFMEPGGEATVDQNASDLIWWNLTKGMTTSWPHFLTECMLMLDFGYYLFEKVFTDTHPERPGKVVWQKLAPRHPMDILRWQWDANGGPKSVTMFDPDAPLREVTIPIEKLVCFTFDKEGGNMAGIPILRSAYKHWYYKTNLEKIDAIQKERHGIGVPIIKLPVNFNNSDKLLAEQMGRNLRTNERAHIVLPPMWEIMFAKLEGHPVDALKSVEYHDLQIQKNILAPFMNGGRTGETDDERIMFLKSARFTAEIVADVINKYCIPQLIDYNYARAQYPNIYARRIGEQADWRTLSFAMRNFVGSNMLTPDDKLEENIREEMDLPKADPATARQTATPQAGGQPSGQKPGQPAPSLAKPPRQNPKPPVGPPAKNAGTDKSGG